VNEKFLVVGGDSNLGSALIRHWRKRDLPVIATTRKKERLARDTHWLDLQSEPDKWSLPASLRAAVLCAGITSQEQCRREPRATRHVNVTQTFKLADRLARNGCFVVFLSTNLVFDGSIPAARAERLTCPKTEYGRQKAEAEEALATLGPSVATVRLTKVFSQDLPLVQTWRRLLDQQSAVEAYTDYLCSPILLQTVVHCLAEVASRRLPGVWQLSARDEISYAEVARQVAMKIGVSASLIRPVRTPQDKLEHLPVHVTLDVSLAVNDLGLQPLTACETVNIALSQ
jgi:dTDP-4-dehydrorhamnose reductase